MTHDLGHSQPSRDHTVMVQAVINTNQVSISRSLWNGRCNASVQHTIRTGRGGCFVEPSHGIESSKWAIFCKQNWRCGMNRKPGYGAQLRANLEPTKGVGRFRQQDGGHGTPKINGADARNIYPSPGRSGHRCRSWCLPTLETAEPEVGSSGWKSTARRLVSGAFPVALENPEDQVPLTPGCWCQNRSRRNQWVKVSVKIRIRFIKYEKVFYRILWTFRTKEIRAKLRNCHLGNHRKNKRNNPRLPDWPSYQKTITSDPPHTTSRFNQFSSPYGELETWTNQFSSPYGDLDQPVQLAVRRADRPEPCSPHSRHKAYVHRFDRALNHDRNISHFILICLTIRILR
ncbi:unnamed protein product [Brassica rapa]|uniref:Uncharacterized protein n=1 Tax=Brassica campestris TaxID=3711 RepID=A0A8D9CWU9_BRACM|nr:unnamed protein product [Brassica rapa]